MPTSRTHIVIGDRQFRDVNDLLATEPEIDSTEIDPMTRQAKGIPWWVHNQELILFPEIAVVPRGMVCVSNGTCLMLGPANNYTSFIFMGYERALRIAEQLNQRWLSSQKSQNDFAKDPRIISWLDRIPMEHQLELK